MRKIKITALVLAVLMVVTAFAGCASKSTVANLDEKVNDLDGKIKDQSEALAGITSTLADIQKALNNQTPSTDLDSIKKDVEENNKEIQKILEELKKQLEEVKKQADAATGNDDDVKKAISQTGAKIDDLKGKFEDAKSNYTAEDIAAIRQIFGDAQATISACTTVDAVNAAFADMQKKLAEHKAVNEKLYDYVLALKGNITDASADKVTEAVNALKDAKTFYKYDDADGNKDALNKYVIGEDETVDLVEEIEKLDEAQNRELPAVKVAAAELVKRIDEIDATYSFDDVTKIVTDYKIWERRATKLSPKNVELVTNYDKLLKAQASALNADTAKRMFEAERISSKLGDEDVEIFGDYEKLRFDGSHVVFTYLKNDGKFALTSEIYAAIDAKISAWAKEYELTDATVEYIINTAKGDSNYYAKYKANKALVAAFEAEYTKLVATNGIFSAIKALNSKKLGSDAVNVATAYKKNATDINAWRDALVKAYEAELKADEEAAYKRDVIAIADTEHLAYAEVLEDNFNAMVKKAQLCKYNKESKTYADYDDGFLNKIEDDTNGNAYYYKLYNFGDADMVTFITLTYPKAQKAADLINGKIEKFDVSKALSIKEILVAIGGYVKFDAENNKLLAKSTDEIKAAVAESEIGPRTIAEFVYAYKTATVYDLSGMINVADYEAKIAEVEKIIKNADAAAAALNNAYRELVGELGFVAVTTANAAKAKEVYTLFTKWLNAGNGQMQTATLINTTASGIKEYKLSDILEKYEYINDEETVLDRKNGAIINLNTRATNILAEEKLVESIYQMMDKVRAFDQSQAFGYDNSSNAAVIKNAYNAARGKFNTQGITSVTVSENPMTENGTDSANRDYAKDQYLWTVKYVTYDQNNKVFKEGSYTNYYYSNNKTALKNVTREIYVTNGEVLVVTTVSLEQEIANKLWKPSNITPDTEANYFQVLTETIPTLVKAGTINGSFSNLAMKDKAIPNCLLPMLAMNFEAKFIVDNLGNTTDKITAAKKSWDPENGGYGFEYIKAITYVVLNVNYSTETLTAAEKAAYKLATNIDTLRTVVNNIIVNRGGDLDIVYGEANSAWMAPLFNLGAEKFEALGYKTSNFKADGLVIRKADVACEHPEVDVNNLCIGKTKVCPDCGETVEGVADHVKGADARECEPFECERCHDMITSNHNYNENSFKIDKVALVMDEDGIVTEVGYVRYTLICQTNAEHVSDPIMVTEGLEFTPASDDSDAKVEFAVVLGNVTYNIVVTYANGVWTGVATAA